MANVVQQKYDIYFLNKIDDVLKHLEKCGRNCYKSECNITDESAPKFITGVLKSGHESVIEHAHFIFKIGVTSMFNILNVIDIDTLSLLEGLNITKNVEFVDGKANLSYILSANPRTFRDIYRETGVYIFLDKIPEVFSYGIPEEKRVNRFKDDIELVGVNTSIYGERHNYLTFRFDTDIGCYKDITRHRRLSWSIESTRYCSYNKDKFNNEIKVVDCSTFMPDEINKRYLDAMNSMESFYMKIASLGAKPDMLRMILPHGTSASVVMSGSIYDLKKMFNLRCDTHAHPTVQKDMKALKNLMEENIDMMLG